MRPHILLAATVLLVAGPALAAGEKAKDGAGEVILAEQGPLIQVVQRRGMFGSGPMLGMHIIPVIVTAVDEKTGLVEGTYGGAALKLHFPPEALDGVRPGTRLSVLLAFSK